jgi:hypothetical protein
LAGEGGKAYSGPAYRAEYLRDVHPHLSALYTEVGELFPGEEHRPAREKVTRELNDLNGALIELGVK